MIGFLDGVTVGDTLVLMVVLLAIVALLIFVTGRRPGP